MKLNREMLPIRDFKLAALHGTVWILLFWVIDHPIEEWAVTVVILYISLWVCREVVARAIWFAVDGLNQQARRVAEKLGVDTTEDMPARQRLRGVLLIAFIGFLALVAVIGASLGIGIPAAGLLGLTPLPSYFNWIGLTLFGVGLVGLSVVLGALALIFSAIEMFLNDKGIDRFHAIREDVAESAAKVAAYTAA